MGAGSWAFLRCTLRMGHAHAHLRLPRRHGARVGRRRLSTLVQGGGVVIAVAVAAAFFALLLAARHQRAQSRAAEETTRTVTQVERVQKLALDLETGLRGFVITGREPFLAPFDAARQRFPGEAERLVALVRGRSAQQALAQRVLQDGQDYVAGDADPLIGERRRSENAAQATLVTQEGKRRMDDLRGDLALLVDVEQRRGDEQRAIADRDAGRTTAFGAGGLVASLALLAGFVLFVRRRVTAP